MLEVSLLLSLVYPKRGVVAIAKWSEILWQEFPSLVVFCKELESMLYEMPLIVM